mgnify:CR=1 FL=1
MAGKDFRIVCMDDSGRKLFRVSLTRRGLTLVGLSGLLLLASLAVLLPLSLARHHEITTLAQNRKDISLQRQRIYAASYQLKSLENGFGDIAEFDAKLRVMLSLEERPEILPMAQGGPLAGPYHSPFQILYTHTLIRDMRERLDSLEISMLLEEAAQQDLFHAAAAQQERLARIPVIWPTRGRFTSRFGYRIGPFSGKTRFHKGIDITAPTGTSIKAAAQGRVVLADWFSTYGMCVEIDHGDGIHTRYGHLSKILVREGQMVYRGDVIGQVGSTGRSVAPHLHYEVHLGGNPVNPLNYILR